MKDNKVYLDHILKAISKIEKHTVGLSKDELLKDEGVQDIVIRNF